MAGTIGLVAVAGLAVTALWITPLFPTQWWWPLILVPGFLVAESAEVHFEFRRQTVSWSLSELALVIGLIGFGIIPTVTSRMLAIAAIQLFKRYSAPKISFNIAATSIEVLFAGSILRAMGWNDLTKPGDALGVIATIVVTGVLGIVLISVAIRVTEGRVNRAFWPALTVPLVAIGPLSAAGGVTVLLLVDISPWGGVLAVGMLAAFWLLYHRYAAAAQDRRSLAEVYEFSESIQNTTSDSDGELVILAAVREKFNAARAALWIPSYLDQEPRSLAVTEDGKNSYPGPDDPDDLLRLETTAPQGARLVAKAARPTAGELKALQRRGVNELIGVSLEIETDEPGYLEVCDRNGDVLHFSGADVELMQSLATHVAAALRARQLQDKIRYDAAHDPVTDLPNRFWLTAAVDAQLANAPASKNLAILMAGIDDFGQVNETLGHAAGDELLRAIAVALMEHAPPQTTLARVGGSQFAMSLPAADLAHAEVAAVALRSALSTRVLVSGVQLAPELTFGIAVAPLHGSSAEMLLQRAEVAFEAARGAGVPTATYSSAMDEQSLRRLQLSADLADAIDSPAISMVFQPIVGAGRGEIAAVELLTRWAHPRLGTITPDEFIPLAERIGLITPLTRRVLRTAIQRCQAWLDEGVVISMAVNISPVTLAEPGFVDGVAMLLRERSFPPELLTFEITEGALISDGLALPVLNRLHDLGVGLSIDDFGTGYSSLSRLRQLPIDEVKIDKSFVLAMSTDPGTNTIARSIIDLAHELGLRVVAEGVEDELTRTLLANMNCDFLQGYLVSRPLTERSLANWLDVRTATRPVDEDRSRRKLYIIR
ncbi:MAG: bifunctional diguanylate cyclase/phosphodiesterase [Geodermatophilaceae bacterium]|nr:bifunctional diguanylate cyclase/phosphodiesterase [Geodermatophilaceae bacterium]